MAERIHTIGKNRGAGVFYHVGLFLFPKNICSRLHAPDSWRVEKIYNAEFIAVFVLVCSYVAVYSRYTPSSAFELRCVEHDLFGTYRKHICGVMVHNGLHYRCHHHISAKETSCIRDSGVAGCIPVML